MITMIKIYSKTAVRKKIKEMKEIAYGMFMFGVATENQVHDAYRVLGILDQRMRDSKRKAVAPIPLAKRVEDKWFFRKQHDIYNTKEEAEKRATSLRQRYKPKKVIVDTYNRFHVVFVEK